MVNNMIEKSKESGNAKTQNALFDSCKENMIRTIDEISKYQPQYTESVSNLQQDCLQVTKDLINRAFATQKTWYSNNAKNPFSTITTQYAEQYRKQSNEVTSQAFNVFDNANQLTLNMLNSARENIKSYGKSLDAVTEFNANLTDTWSNLFTSAQEQYSK